MFNPTATKHNILIFSQVTKITTQKKLALNLVPGDMIGTDMTCWHAALHRPECNPITPFFPGAAVTPIISLAAVYSFFY
jgi:hypothetical protein